MEVVTIELQVKSYFDEENKHWIVKAKENNISGYGKSVNEAKEMFNKKIQETLHPNQSSLEQRVCQLENNFWELRGQLLSFGFKKNSVIILSIDSILKNKTSKINQLLKN